jgi:hypothetical protein
LGEIKGDLLERDFWPTSLKVCSGHNFRVARYPTRMAMSTRTEAVDKFRAYNLQTITNAEENL